MIAGSRVELALRRLQQIDQAVTMHPDARAWLLEAEDALADVLHLECTGAVEGPGVYEHNGDTCPVHEWLKPDEDHPEAERVAELAGR